MRYQTCRNTEKEIMSEIVTGSDLLMVKVKVMKIHLDSVMDSYSETIQEIHSDSEKTTVMDLPIMDGAYRDFPTALAIASKDH